MTPSPDFVTHGAGDALRALVGRDLRLALRRRSETLLPPLFFVMAAGLFPFGIGATPDTLRLIGPGVVWVCALLALMLSVHGVLAGDHADGSLEQMLLSGQAPAALAAARAFAHWLLAGLPLVLVAPLLGLLYALPTDTIAALVISLLLGTPILSLLGGLAAALTLGLRSGGMLVFLLVLPLAVPVLIFGSGAVVAVQAGLSPRAHYALLGALLIASLVLAPPAIGAALRISTE